MRPTAIVVDDHPSFRKMARRLLTAAGYDVVGEAADAAGAVTAASQCHPAFVLLDVLLPDGSGLDVADLIGGPGAPIDLSTMLAPTFLRAMDQNKDGSITREEFQQAFAKWFDSWSEGKGSLTEEQLRAGLNRDLAAQPPGTLPPAIVQVAKP